MQVATQECLWSTCPVEPRSCSGQVLFPSDVVLKQDERWRKGLKYLAVKIIHHNTSFTKLFCECQKERSLDQSTQVHQEQTLIKKVPAEVE